MKLPPFELVEPKSLKKACQLLERGKGTALAIAGGTDLLMALKNWLKRPEVLVDLKTLPRLNRIAYSEKKGLAIGGLATLRQLSLNEIIRKRYPLLAQAALEVGTPQLQAMGTIGGNLCQDSLCVYYNRSPVSRQGLKPCTKLGGKACHAVPRSPSCWATYSGDMAPALMVLQATVTVEDGKSKHVIPLKRLFSGDGKKPNRLKPGQIITEIHVPPPRPGSGGTYLKMRVRRAIDYPLLGVAFWLTLRNGDGICADAALALTAVERAPLIIKEAKNLRGKKLVARVVEELGEAAYRQAHPLSNVCDLSPGYRKEMVRVLVRSAAEQALQRATTGGGAF
jgi:4-hydroxybenzoyl-CoA reductase subunit beta